MQYTNVFGYSFSRLMLGTVALGMDYGIANRKGQPGEKESLAILSCAMAAGINSFDTARTYGSAEDLLGNFAEQEKMRKSINIVTKFKISPGNMTNFKNARMEAFESVLESIRRLKCDRISICLFHMDRDLPIEIVIRILPAVFDDLQQHGLIEMAGVSIDHPSEMTPLMEQDSIKIFQVPINVFDQRLITNGIIRQLKNSGKVVFARSVFLQGLFFLDPEQLNGNLRPAAAWLKELRSLAECEGMTVAQLAFSYIRDLEGIGSIVFGAENEDQVRQNLALLDGAPVSDSIRERIKRSFGFLPQEIITPRFWQV